MIALSLSVVASAVGGNLRGPDASCRGVSTDTRTLHSGELFFALRGPRFDAHELLAAAAAAGAAGAVVERPSAQPASQVLVADTRRALGLLARSWRERFKVPLIAVTGSAGKTTVKEMLAAIMRTQGTVLATRGNLNNDIGVPLTLFELADTHDYAVIEMGANRPGDIACLVDIARPQVGVLTLCAPAHLDGFGDIETVARSKGEIITGLPEDGTAVINADDAFAPLWRELAGARRCISFGDAGMVSARDIETRAAHTRFRLCCDLGEVAIEMQPRGAHNVRNALAAAAAARALDLPLSAIRAGLAAVQPVAGRLEVRQARGGVRLLDDSYNANPASLAAALAVLADEPGRRWLVLGDMAELGAAACDYHRAAGRAASAAGVERLFTLGELAREAAAEFAGTSLHAHDHGELMAALDAALDAVPDAATTILIKGSRVMALDEIADALSAGSSAPC